MRALHLFVLVTQDRHTDRLFYLILSTYGVSKSINVNLMLMLILRPYFSASCPSLEFWQAKRGFNLYRGSGVGELRGPISFQLGAVLLWARLYMRPLNEPNGLVLFYNQCSSQSQVRQAGGVRVLAFSMSVSCVPLRGNCENVMMATTG